VDDWPYVVVALLLYGVLMWGLYEVAVYSLGM
jgi:hypothetical protein